ncbi:uncharacterized protein AMSG_12428 [Thecamonas trahens ATCC 50062]|uniref:Uncharacterized protein n=1 Tax=Thecamonas trahens ATCC 50062 TaxID=461836 RepID=A0A0L0DUD4_THETB|nr:hypothetical protein AMSG_12428 [Thecamonas trahens ATCC 50062]KNC55812.1 hypothetical protein AMSG_12428 [Thecamonas trahens ATCC 50062]|eukprot:XP_013752842.1 hypothetical protein AMSG_12428 [Thecamonas trahens ATCC 50062]
MAQEPSRRPRVRHRHGPRHQRAVWPPPPDLARPAHPHERAPWRARGHSRAGSKQPVYTGACMTRAHAIAHRSRGGHVIISATLRSVLPFDLPDHLTAHPVGRILDPIDKKHTVEMFVVVAKSSVTALRWATIAARMTSTWISATDITDEGATTEAGTDAQPATAIGHHKKKHACGDFNRSLVHYHSDEEMNEVDGPGPGPASGTQPVDGAARIVGRPAAGPTDLPTRAISASRIPHGYNGIRSAIAQIAALPSTSSGASSGVISWVVTPRVAASASNYDSANSSLTRKGSLDSTTAGTRNSSAASLAHRASPRRPPAAEQSIHLHASGFTPRGRPRILRLVPAPDPEPASSPVPAPEPAPEPEPEPESASLPVSAPESVPVSAPESVPVSAPESAPELEPESVPSAAAAPAALSPPSQPSLTVAGHPTSSLDSPLTTAPTIAVEIAAGSNSASMSSVDDLAVVDRPPVVGPRPRATSTSCGNGDGGGDGDSNGLESGNNTTTQFSNIVLSSPACEHAPDDALASCTSSLTVPYSSPTTIYDTEPSLRVQDDNAFIFDLQSSVPHIPPDLLGTSMVVGTDPSAAPHTPNRAAVPPHPQAGSASTSTSTSTSSSTSSSSLSSSTSSSSSSSSASSSPSSQVAI